MVHVNNDPDLTSEQILELELELEQAQELARLTAKENDIIKNLKRRMNVYNPKIAQRLLDGFANKEPFQTQAGLEFIESLEWAIEEAKRDKPLVAVIIILCIVAFLFAILAIRAAVIQLFSI